MGRRFAAVFGYYVPCLDILLPVASYSRRVLDLKVPTIYRRDQFGKFKT